MKNIRNSAEVWSDDVENRITSTKSRLADMSIQVRSDQLQYLLRKFSPTSQNSVLDIGMSPNESLPDTNFFQKAYPFKNQITACSVEDCQPLLSKYPEIKFIQIKENQPLPFADGHFDLVTSWATLEHVGSYEQQAFFLRECYRVSRKGLFLTTPYRGCFYEPHSGIFFLHWLPLRFFRFVCRAMGKNFWAEQKNLNPLWVSDVRAMLPKEAMASIKIYRMFKILPSHLVITATKAG